MIESPIEKQHKDIKRKDTAHEDRSPNYNLQYLLAELARIDVLFQYYFARTGVDGANAMAGLVVTADDLQSLFRNSTRNPLPTEVEDELQQRYSEAETFVESLLQEAEEAEQVPRFVSICEAFQLSTFERDVLLICLAPLIDPRYERFFGYLHNDVTVKRPTVYALLELLLDSSIERLQRMPDFLDRGRLFAFRLLYRVSESGGQSALPNQQLAVEESVFAWLLDRYHPDPRLQDHLSLLNAAISEEEHLLAAEVWDSLIDAINGQAVALFFGSDLAVQRAVSHMLADHANLPLLRVDLAAIVAQGVAPAEVLRLVVRDARMIGAAIFLEGGDALVTQNQPSAAVLKILFEAAIPIIISSEKEWYAHGVDRSDAILRITFPKPSYRQRCALWDFFVAQSGHELAPDIDLQALASQFVLESQQVQDAVASARDMAIQRGGAIRHRDLLVAARVHSSPNLSGLAQKIEPRYEWGDVVLPVEQKTMLRELIQTVRGRGIVMEEWGVGQKLKTSSGVAILFAGPPGTGKTMSAEVIASELGLDLYKIDLSTVVSKFIGETEKNLGKIFDEAQSSSAVLFFDEADAIFGKRSEAKDSHDRYANMEISYLLQRMESYDGITILATNLRANMDEAFTRRMQFIVDFPFPDVEERMHIWHTLFPAELPKSDNIDLSLLATRYKLAGGNIRNIIAGAAFLAASNGGVVTMDHLLHTTRRELQKLGRLISDVDLTY